MIQKLTASPTKEPTGNFTAQQQAPDSSFDTLTEANSGTANQIYNPIQLQSGGSTTLVSGSPHWQARVHMTFGSYGSGSSAQALYTHQSTTTISGTNYYSFLTSGATSSGVTLSASNVKFTHSFRQSSLQSSRYLIYPREYVDV